MTNAGWLLDLLHRSEREGWCVKPFCTTCGARKLRSTFQEAAVLASGLDRHPSSAELSPVIVSAFRSLDGAHLYRWRNAARTLLIDWAFAIDGLLTLRGSAVGEELEAMHRHAANLREQASLREEFEKPENARKRREEKRQRIAELAAERQERKRIRDAQIAKFVKQLSDLSSKEFYEAVSREDIPFPIHVIPGHLIPTELPTGLSRHSMERLVERTMRTAGAWRRVRQFLLAQLAAPQPER